MTIVVGAGIAGLITALRLSARGERVVVVDGESTIGGLTRPWQIGGITWDRFYHVVLGSDGKTKELLRDVGLEDRLTFRPVKTSLYAQGHLYPFSSAADFLKFPVLGMLDKIRLVATIAHAKYAGNDESYEWVGILDYLTRWSGPRTVERIWRPLLRAKLGEQHAFASAAFIRATIKRLQGARKGHVGGEEYGYVRGGYAEVLKALQARLEKQGVEFALGRPVRVVTLQGDYVRVALEGKELTADRAILTVPSPVCAAIAPQLTPPERRALAQDRYFGVVCTSMLVNRRLGDSYVTNVADPGFPFTGIINMSALVDRSELGGYDLIYVPKYGPADDRSFRLADDVLIAQSSRGLAKIFPGFRQSDVVAAAVARARHVFPFPRIGRVESLPPARTSLGRLAIINNGRLRYATLNVSDTIEVVDEGLEELEADPAWRAASESCAFAGSR
ncbi:MAG: FAD-dependent oxidoreductase [Candidatus Tyrphobacter sp.]